MREELICRLLDLCSGEGEGLELALPYLCLLERLWDASWVHGTLEEEEEEEEVEEEEEAEEEAEEDDEINTI